MRGPTFNRSTAFRRGAGVLLAAALMAQAQAAGGVRPVAAFEPSALLGDWYELASLPPLFFQRDCVRNVRLKFALVSSEQMSLIRACVAQDGGVERGEARLRPTPGEQRPDWRRMQYSAVALGGEYRFWLARDYWVIERDPQDRWLVIGQENRRGAAVLSRQPTLGLATLAEIIGRVKAQGYDACELMVTPQLGGMTVRRSVCEALNQGLAAQGQ